WRPGITLEKTFERELNGLAPAARLRNAADILAACSPEALSLLNQDILQITGANLEFYNLLQSTVPFRVKARIQALHVLPMLKWEFHSMSGLTDRIRRRIDEGKSVWDAFLEVHPGKASILRRIASAETGPETWRGDLVGLLALLDPLPPEKVPSSELEWNAFHSICLGLGLDRALQRYHENNEERSQVKLQWMAEAARIGWQKAYEKFAAFEGGMGAIADAFDLLDEIRNAGNYLARKSGEKFSSEDERKEKSRKRWLKAPSKFGVFRIVEYSIRWHRAVWTHAGLPESVDINRSVWPSLLAQPVELGANVYAVTLANAQALTEEGRRMQHCVGGYWHDCFLGNSHIISLRDSSGQSLSTLQVSLPKDGTRKCEIIQHRAHRNKTPGYALRSLEGKLKALIVAQADFSALARWRKSAEIIDDNLADGEIDALTREYDEERFERLATIIGRDRLIGLFAS
ncbi:MAG: hypothetical protein EBS01_13695, partial [Verrucomicrobia bacterium]|nr:hypothetical protein [Verrucomicrobiota bacterium]